MEHCVLPAGQALVKYEHDFAGRVKYLPAAARRRGGGASPGAIVALERRIAAAAVLTTAHVRHRWYRNLRAVADKSGAIDRLPEQLVDTLMPL